VRLGETVDSPDESVISTEEGNLLLVSDRWRYR
jgi:hypothetical protein